MAREPVGNSFRMRQKFDRSRQSLKNHASRQQTSPVENVEGLGYSVGDAGNKKRRKEKDQPEENCRLRNTQLRPRQDQRSDETIRTASGTRLRGSQIDQSWSVPPPPQKANATEPLVVRGIIPTTQTQWKVVFSLDRFSENSPIPDDRWFTPIGGSVSQRQRSGAMSARQHL